MARKKFNLKSKKTWKTIGLGALACTLGIGAVMGVGALLNREEDLTKTINPTYAIGGLTEQGKYLETEGSIYTKDAFECQGLDIDLAFENNVSYRVFFYDEDKDFISSTQTLTDNYDENTTPSHSRYARIVITPNDDDKISIFEKNGYAKQLTIEVNKEQKDIQVPFKGSNKFVYLQGYNMNNGSGGTDAYYETQSTSGAGYNLMKLVQVTDCSKICIKVDKSLLADVKLNLLTKNSSIGAKALSLCEYEEIFFNGNTYLVMDLQDDCTGVSMYANPEIDYSNFEFYAW